MFLSPSAAHVFCIAQKLQKPNLQCCYGHPDNSEYEIVSEELSEYPFETLYITFIIIKPITKFDFRFHNHMLRDYYEF